jgi:hypothetical protein
MAGARIGVSIAKASCVVVSGVVENLTGTDAVATVAAKITADDSVRATIDFFIIGSLMS